MTDSNGDMSSQENEASGKNIPSMVEKFVIRLPCGLRNKIKQLSEQNRRSMNAEIIMVLEKHIQQSMMSSELSELSELTDGESGLTDRQLTEKLESLPPEKKEALLELLG